jgi:hypothetical protein
MQRKEALGRNHGSKEAREGRKVGVHQGDPLAPLLFALAIHPFILSLAERFEDVLQGGIWMTVMSSGIHVSCAHIWSS